MTALLTLLGASAGYGQSSSDDGSEKAWARSPKEIAFQNDTQWEDNRWQAADVGPFLSASIETGRGPTLKGIAIRVGERGQAAVCFDTARLRISAAWTGGFLEFESRRFGLIGRPRSGGQTFFSTEKLAGWAKDGRFTPEPNEITLPKGEQGNKVSGGSVVHLPKDWAAYRGLYTSGPRVVLSYMVGDTPVLESPWYVQSGRQEAFIRSLEVGPSALTMQMWVADEDSQVTVIGPASRATIAEGRPVLTIAPHAETVRLKLLITHKETDAAAIRTLRAAAGDVEDLSQLIAEDTGRFPEVLSTAGTTTEAGGPYVIDTLTLPFENPYKALLFTSGHDFFTDGSAAVCTVHGDVWTVTGIDRDLDELQWRRYATGLFQPLGLKIVDDLVYVIGRDQITRLHDRNADGEADYYENFNNDLSVTPRNHDFVTCLDTDPEGNFYFIHAMTGVMRVSADGSTLTSVADGFRNPNGMAVGPDGTITAAPQQGQWTPESSLIVVKDGGYYGYGGPRITPDRPTGWDRPMCFIPRSMDNSGGAQLWVDSDRWGPLRGRMLHLSYGQCRLLLALTEEVDRTVQGGTIKFPTAPADFESGIMRGRFHPRDGQLYVTGLRGWQTRAVRDGCFQRVRYTGGPVNLPTRVETYTNGIKLTFSDPLDPALAENPENYLVEQWNYLWSAEYGSPDFSVKNPKRQGRDEVPVVSATVMDDGHSIFLEMPGRHPVMQISISWLLASLNGNPFRGTYAHTINAVPRESFPDAQIVRRERTRRIPEEIEQRLGPGLQFRFESRVTGEVDLHTSRLVAFEQATDKPPTPFLPAGPFSIEATGTLCAPLSGFYDFKLEGTGSAELWINAKRIVNGQSESQAAAETAEPILLHKGHNRIRLRYASPAEGRAQLDLSWKGYDFAWEPVPPDAFFHDSGSRELVAAQQRRLGRRLFADHHCTACHRTDTEQTAMFELSLEPPDLTAVGDRLRGEWLQQWLLSPRALRPHTYMPAVLGSGADAKQDAADITAFLLSQQAAEESPAPETAVAAEELDGEPLYESLGCMSCHHFEPPGTEDEFGRLTLHFAGAKYRPGALAAFLSKPNAHDSATTMPDFRLSDSEAGALARFVRSRSTGELNGLQRRGDADRGQRRFAEAGCRQCHRIGQNSPRRPPQLAWPTPLALKGCLAAGESADVFGTPDFSFSDDERQALAGFLHLDLKSLGQASVVETSARLFQRLQCAHCHDRDGHRSHRMLAILEEGSGRFPEPLPQLTWAGEKFQPQWTRRLLAGEVDDKSRPWIVARMPAFPAYAAALADGLAAEHGVDPREQESHAFDPNLAAIGETLTRQTGLDCRQCHGIGDLLPRGDKQTKIALGINFAFIRDHLRRESYHRFLLDPPRYDINSKMVRLTEDGLTTKLKEFFDADAHQQFDAVWHYIQSLPSDSER